MCSKREISELFQKYLLGNIVPEEIQRLKKLVADMDESSLDNQLQQLWNVFLPEDRNVKSFHEISTNLKTILRPEKQRSIGYYFWRGVAAVLLPILFVALTYLFHEQRSIESFKNQEYMVYTNKGEKATVTLPDGSKVTINAGTTLKYPSVFISGDIEVEVIGEAFFNVAHDAKRSFVVNAGQVSVRVFGTRFNVKSYQNDDQIEVSLEEGSVEVNLDQQATIRMTPDEQIVFDKRTLQISKHKVNTEHYVGWKEGKFYFRNTSFEEIVKQLERTFNVHIFINSEKLKKTNFTGDFVRGENLEQILHVMTVDKRMSYQIEENRIYISEQ